MYYRGQAMYYSGQAMYYRGQAMHAECFLLMPVCSLRA